MKRTNIPAAIEKFKQEFGDLEPLEPQLIGFYWAIGIWQDDIILVKKYPIGLYEFSSMTKENYEHFKGDNYE